MSLKLCFTRRFNRLLRELKIDDGFLRKEKLNLFKGIKKKIRSKRLFFDTHGNLKNSCYVHCLIRIQTYSIDNCHFNKKRRNFLRDLLHELRHFQQHIIYQMDMNEYSLKDMNEITKEYYNSKIEIDARKYEKRYVKIYKRLRKLYG
jgi:nicotinic acid phosphoribosyltransferase